MTDAYTNQRAGFLERLTSLAGKSTYRVPNESRSTAPLPMTDHDLASALAFARQGSSDIGPDIAYAMACQTDCYRSRIVRVMAGAIAGSQGHLLRGMREYVVMIADDAYALLVWLRKPEPPPAIHDRARYMGLVAAAASMMESSADESVRRAERAFLRQAD